MNRVPACKLCRCALNEGPHLHESQCIKALKNERTGMADAIIALGVMMRDVRNDLGVTRGLLANATMKAGGKLEVPDAGVVPVPDGHYVDLKVKRNEKDDGFVVTSTIEKEEAAPEPAKA